MPKYVDCLNPAARPPFAATFVDKILKGAKPSELSIEQPTRFELIVNAKTAKAQNIEIPTLILAQADQIIE